MLTVQAFTFNPVQEQTYIFYNEEGLCGIIDPGCYFASEELMLREFVRKNELKPVLLLNTHCHFDHIFGNPFIRQQYNLVPHLHPLDEMIRQNSAAAAARWSISFAGDEGPMIPLADGDRLKLGEDEFSVIHTPGHSPGSVSFYFEKQNLLFAGDVLFNRGIGRTDLPGGNPKVLEETILTRLYTLPPQTRVYPGHGPETTIGAEIKGNPYVRPAS